MFPNESSTPQKDNASPKLTAEAHSENPRKIGCMVYLWGGGAILLIVFWFNVFRSVPPRVSPETTHVTEPRTPDGRFVDYMAAVEEFVYPPEMMTDNNGYRLVMRTIGPLEKSSDDITQKRYAMLGLDYIFDKPTVPYMDPYEYFKRRYDLYPEEFDEIVAYMKALRQEAESDDNGEMGYGGANRTIEEEMKTNSWLAWDYVRKYPDLHKLQMTQDWLAADKTAFDVLTAAAKKPVFVTPMIVPSDHISFYDVLLPDIQGIRSFARALAGRVTIRVAEGDIDGAIDDILTCHRLGRHLTRPGCLVQQLVGIACEGIAHDLAFNGNLASQADAEQLRRLQEGLRNLPQYATWEDGMELERLATLDSLTAIMNDPANLKKMLETNRTTLPITVEPMLWCGKDWNVVFKTVNENFDDAIAGGYLRAGLSTNPLRYLSLRMRSEEFAVMFLDFFLPATGAFREAIRRMECCYNMKRIQIAMFLYQAEHGTLPPTFSVDADGRPLQSWRVLLLPYFGEESLAELHSQIRLDEPWDSEHNLPFHKMNIDIYRCPSANGMDGDANYSVIVGEDLLFTADGKGQTVTGHGRNMMMLAERNNTAVCWMQPDGEITQSDAEIGVGHISRTTTAPISSGHTGGCNFAMRDGGVTFISETMKPDDLAKLVRGTAKERP